MYFVICFTIWLIIVQTANSRSLEDRGDFKLTILHVNDIHAHIEEMTEYTTRCRPEDKEAEKCIGGAGRLLTKINEIRDLDPEHTLVLNAGDFYQGTVWYTIFKYKPLLEFANMIGYDAMGFGNHDLDDGVAGFVPFINDANFPILASNINTTMEPDLERSKWTKSVVKVVDGRKIGIIGYITRETPHISNPGKNLRFLDEITSVQIEAQRLKSEEGVDILIALGHAGYVLDMKMAAEIEEIDVVVGGHSHTFLWSGPGENPSVETVSGPYPTFITQASGKKVPVVQAYCYSKYLGHFELYFDERGELKTPVDGVGVKNASPILLDKTIKEDPHVLDKIKEYRPKITEFTRIVGKTLTKLKRNQHFESNLGTAIADAFVQYGEWKDAKIAFVNNGGIRSDIEAGEITGEDILAVLPFNNTIDRIIMSGKGIRAVLEIPGTFLQVSGLRIVYRNSGNGEGYKLESIKTPCNNSDNSSVPVNAKSSFESTVVFNKESWCDLDEQKNYTVVLSNFLARGGGTQKCNFQCNSLEHQTGTSRDYETLFRYLGDNFPLDQKIEGRLQFL